ncbi:MULTISPECIES: hypothetical protein [unclassified Actinomyces]|uniref:hypothetical protein n=1 Tax=unclassified Actinomyces TaxID=2609248 RepID=UPI0008C2FF7C|nr:MULTISPECIES: hypothetical protein [unclassified Actinomyces]MDU7238529.1 hypothetical protein [Actinomyces sp.]OFR33554.1 hypothetical protein HMPREF2891_07260 [Actinomyces sp. HMSC065F11]
MDDKNTQDQAKNDLSKHRHASRLGTPGLSAPKEGADSSRSARVSKSLKRARLSQRRAGTKTRGRAQQILSIPARYLSATIAILLAASIVISNLVFDTRAVVMLVIVVAIVVFARGWADLVQTPVRYTSLVTILIVGIVTVIAISVSDDFAWATVGLGMVVLVAAVMEATRPLPRTDLLHSLSASVFGGFVVVIGSAWVTLCESELWSAVMVTAALAFIVTMVGNQLGASAGANALWALLLGPLSAVTVTGIALAVGQPASLLSFVFASMSTAVPPQVSLLLMSALIGLGMGGVIVIVDMLFGEHDRRIPEAGAFSRGAMKFLLAVMPIYVIVRVGALL